MKLLTIGTAVQDTIIEGPETRYSPGGIVYTVLALSSHLEEDEELFLASALPESLPETISKAFRKVKFYYITPAPAAPSVTLTLYKDKERDEKFDYCDIPITVPLEGINRFDGILINMITGFDITLETMKGLRSAYKGIIYMDIHSLSRGVDESFRRKFRPIPDAEEWLGCIDVVQCNENELRTLSDRPDENEIIKFVLGAGVKYLLVTKGGKGARMFFYENGVLKSLYASPPAVNVITNVGCGDVFGGAFFYYFVKTKNVFNSFYRAIQSSAFATGYSSVYEIYNIKNDVISRFD